MADTQEEKQSPNITNQFHGQSLKQRRGKNTYSAYLGKGSDEGGDGTRHNRSLVLDTAVLWRSVLIADM